MLALCAAKRMRLGPGLTIAPRFSEISRHALRHRPLRLPAASFQAVGIREPDFIRDVLQDIGAAPLVSLRHAGEEQRTYRRVSSSVRGDPGENALEGIRPDGFLDAGIEAGLAAEVVVRFAAVG